MDGCWKCGHEIEFHTSDFELNNNWKDNCHHTGEEGNCTCDEFNPTMDQLMAIILGKQKPMIIRK